MIDEKRQGDLIPPTTHPASLDRDTIVFESSADFLEAIARARMWSSHPKDHRPKLEGVRLERAYYGEPGADTSRVYMVATNGFAMWVRGPFVDHSTTKPAFVTSVDLSLFDVRAVVGVIKALRRPCAVVFSKKGNAQIARIGRTTLELEGLDGEHFPPWRAVYPKASKDPKVSTLLVSPVALLRAFKSLKPKTPSFSTRIEFGATELDPVMIRGTVADEPTFVLLMPMRGEFDEHGAPK